MRLGRGVGRDRRLLTIMTALDVVLCLTSIAGLVLAGLALGLLSLLARLPLFPDFLELWEMGQSSEQRRQRP